MLGLTRFNAPNEATHSRVFRAIDTAVFEELVREWIQARLGGRSFEHVAIDGEPAWGSRREDMPAVHLLAAYASEVGAVRYQLRVGAKTNEHKDAWEWLGVLPLRGADGHRRRHVDPPRRVRRDRPPRRRLRVAGQGQPTHASVGHPKCLRRPGPGAFPSTETTSRRVHQHGQPC